MRFNEAGTHQTEVFFESGTERLPMETEIDPATLRIHADLPLRLVRLSRHEVRRVSSLRA